MTTDHAHHPAASSITTTRTCNRFRSRPIKPLNPDKFFPWVQNLVQTEGPNILRCKGILSFKDDDQRFVFQGVHMILDGDHQRPWNQGREARTAASSSSAAICRNKKIRRGIRKLPRVNLVLPRPPDERHSQRHRFRRRAHPPGGGWRRCRCRAFSRTHARCSSSGRKRSCLSSPMPSRAASPSMAAQF